MATFLPFARASVLVLAALLASPAQAAARHVLGAPEHGAVVLALPDAWQVTRDPDGAAPTYRIRAPDEADFIVLLTLIWLGETTSPDEAAALDAIIRDAAQQAAASAIEERLDLRSLPGASGPGTYFQATDRAPGPDGYRRLTQGYQPVGPFVVMYTVLTQDDPGIVRTAQEALARADYQASP